MIEWLIEQWFAVLEGGLIVALLTIARDRRKAVDRFNGILRLTNSSAENIKARQHVIEQVKAAGLLADGSQDAIGRGIARSVERVTKEKR